MKGEPIVDLLIKNGNLVTEKGLIKADLAVSAGKIEAIGFFPGDKADRVLDAVGKLVFPGVIDAHTHYGLVTKGAVTVDGWEEGTRSAACGGVTTCIDYADPLSGEQLDKGAKQRLAEADGEALIDYTVHMVIHRWDEKMKPQLAALKNVGIESLKIFTTYDQRLPEKDLKALLTDAKSHKMLVTVHAEDNSLVEKARIELEEKGEKSPARHGDSRPAKAEEKAIIDVLESARIVKVPVYFVHISSGLGARRIAEAQKAGQKVFGETCPHYLLLDDSLYAREDPRPYIMTPPLRPKGNQDQLWQSIINGTLQVVATDHCAYTLEQKALSKDCFTTIPGIPGSETMLPLLYNYGVNGGRFDPCYLAYLLSTNPAKIFGLYPRKGSIRPGSDADLVIFDPGKRVVLDGRKLHSASNYTPFDGKEMKGYPETTILRGNLIYHKGKFIGAAGQGRFIKAETVSAAYKF